MRSRVTPNSRPTSSKVRGRPSSSPKRSFKTFRSRGVNVSSTSSSCSLSIVNDAASAGASASWSSIKSPRWLSSSSPIGVSSEMGSCAILMISRTRSTGRVIACAISSAVGSRPSSCSSEPTAEEIAQAMTLPVERVREIIKIAQEPISLETPIGEEEDSHLGDFIEDQDALAPAEAASFTMLKEQLEDVLETLTPRERKVLKLRFGLDDGRPRTLEEVGREFGVTRERIRQIEAKALRKLRHPSRSKRLKDFIE